MLNFRYSRLPARFSEQIKKCVADFPKHRTSIETLPLTRLPWQTSEIEIPRVPNNYPTIVIVGIGGSSLGAKTLISALGSKGKEVLFLDNVDPHFINEQLAQLNLRRTLFVLISKSGETIEVLSLAAILYARIKSAHNFLIITDNKKSALGIFGTTHQIPCITSPSNIPGRFSVLSAVGLVPAQLAGLPIKKIIDGARRTSFKNAYTLACHQYLHFTQKKNIVVIFPYAERLSDFVDWYIQLLAESVGKSKKIGITPVKAMGVRDQHSQLQLFLDGPNDKFFIFIKAQQQEHDVRIPGKRYTLKNLFDAEYKGVLHAFAKRKKPFVEISFSSLSEEIIGQLLFFLQLQISFLGSLFGINIENQPAVELSKLETQRILKSL